MTPGKRTKILLSIWLPVLLTVFSSNSAAQDPFLEHPDKLVPTKATPYMSFYLVEDANTRLQGYTKIMIDEPLVFIAADSPYKGIKLARLNGITAGFRAAMIKAMSQDYEVVEKPGKDVLFLRLAMVDLSLKKKRFHILAYTPIGLVLRGGKEVAESEFDRAVEHLSLLGLKIEGQLYDSESAELLGEFVNDRPADRKDPESWHQMKLEMTHYGELIDCMLSNSRSGSEKEAECVKQYGVKEHAARNENAGTYVLLQPSAIQNGLLP